MSPASTAFRRRKATNIIVKHKKHITLFIMIIFFLFLFIRIFFAFNEDSIFRSYLYFYIHQSDIEKDIKAIETSPKDLITCLLIKHKSVEGTNYFAGAGFSTSDTYIVHTYTPITKSNFERYLMYSNNDSICPKDIGKIRFYRISNSYFLLRNIR